MDFNDTAEEAKFRKEASDWLSANAEKKEHSRDVYRPAEMTGEGGESSALQDAKDWMTKKYEAGWACLHWPKEYGGRDATAIERVIWAQEESKYKVPGGFHEIGQGMAGPTMMLYATEEQKKQYLPPMAKGQEIWCQLFSEPGAGSDLEELKSLSNSSVVEKQKFITEAEILQKQIQSEYGELQTVLDKLEPEFDIVFIENEIERFNRQIESIGPINLAAREEFKIEEERNQEIESQLNELNKAIETLQSAIKKIDQESRTKFQDTLDSVNSEIAKLFPKLFGGGHAKLELTGEDVLESGVVLKAMPPGKKNVSVSQLSGGEKAMSAIAMVFSFFSLNPSPFCILDEIDAPLDDLNTFRYISMVEEMSKKIQFIYITHNKISMEKSKHLMGITMEEAGVSRLVSVDVEEALSLAVNE